MTPGDSTRKVLVIGAARSHAVMRMVADSVLTNHKFNLAGKDLVTLQGVIVDF